MSRIRSRQVESGSIPERAIRRGAVARDKLQPRVVGAPQILPGSASRAIQGSQVTAEAQLSRETINYFSGIIIPLATEGWSAPAQDAGMPLDLDDLVFVEWAETQAVPGLSGMEEDELRLPATLINTVVNGYCNIVVSGRFATYTGDALVEIWRWSQRHGDQEEDDLRQVWPPAVWPEAVTDGGRLYGEGHAIVVSEGDALAVRIIHESETAQTLDLAVEVYAVSRYRLERNPFEPPVPRPWAWFRGDSMTLDGSRVIAMTDRTGNDRDIEVFTGDTDRHATLVASALDGKPGADFRREGFAGAGRAELTGDLATASMWEAGTIVQVVTGVAANDTFEFTNVLARKFLGPVALYMSVEQEAGPALVPFVDSGSRQVYADSAPLGSGPFVIVSRMDASTLDLTVGGTLLGTDTGAAGPFEVDLIAVGGTGRMVVLDTIFFDASVDLDADLWDFGTDGVSTVNAYLAARYPSL